MAGTGRRVWALRPFDYQDLRLDRGQAFELRGARNDERLLGLGYVKPVGKGQLLYTCNHCGGEFIGELERRSHGDKRHPNRPMTAEQEDRQADREERMLAQVAPIGVGAAGA